MEPETMMYDGDAAAWEQFQVPGEASAEAAPGTPATTATTVQAFAAGDSTPQTQLDEGTYSAPTLVCNPEGLASTSPPHWAVAPTLAYDLEGVAPTLAYSVDARAESPARFAAQAQVSPEAERSAPEVTSATIPYGEETCNAFSVARSATSSGAAADGRAVSSRGAGAGTSMAPPSMRPASAQAELTALPSTPAPEPASLSAAEAPAAGPVAVASATAAAGVNADTAGSTAPGLAQAETTTAASGQPTPTQTAAACATEPEPPVATSRSGASTAATAAAAATAPAAPNTREALLWRGPAAPAKRRLCGKQAVPQGPASAVPAVASTSAPVPARHPPAPAVVARRPAGKVGARVRVKGDGWGAGEGTYLATITEVDDMTYTVVFKTQGKKFEETCVLREHCALPQEELQSSGKRRRT